jgi:hypothetical protein
LQLGTGELFADRCANANLCEANLHLTLPILVDREDNTVTRAYNGWPLRLVIVDRAGNISYKSAGTEDRIRSKDVAQWLAGTSGSEPTPPQ